MDPKTHWEKIYSTKAPNQVTWYSPHLETSLVLIHRAAGATSASIIDVGGGESTLVDDLLARGYQNITILDISQTAIDVTKKRLKELAERVRWLAGDVTKGQRSTKAVSVLDRLGLNRGGLHAFRHGRVSVLQENGVPGDLVKEWIGHSSLRTTSRSTHMRPEFRERVAAEVGLFRSMLDPIGPNLKESNAA